MVALPGIISAQRFQRAADLRPDAQTWPYMTIYEVETVNIQSVVKTIADIASIGGLQMSDALDQTGTYAVFYEACGAEVFATT